MKIKKHPSLQSSKLTKSGKKTIAMNFIWIILFGIVFFFSAGTVNIVKAWIYISIAFIYSIISGFIYWKFIPDLANRRAEELPGIKKWVLILIEIYFLYQLIIMPIILGFDIIRYHWSELSIYFSILGIILYILSSIVIEWSLLVNRHFEGVVRIQEEINHKVISTGPYSIIRHPGYFAMILGGFAPPLILGSLYGIIATLLSSILLIIRTYLEDKTLKNELNGYKKYCKKVRYRLFPLIW